MKYTKESYVVGECFICKNKCGETAYLHEHCAVAQYEENKRRIKKSIEQNKL